VGGGTRNRSTGRATSWGACFDILGLPIASRGDWSTCWTTRFGPIRRSARPIADDSARDDPDVREVIELTLEGHGYEVNSVAGGQASLALLAHEPFGLIVCDL